MELGIEYSCGTSQREEIEKKIGHNTVYYLVTETTTLKNDLVDIFLDLCCLVSWYQRNGFFKFS